MPNYWFDHVHLLSPDPIKTAKFYEKTFGAKKVTVSELSDGRTSVELNLSGVAIRVMSPRTQPLVPNASPTGLEHFGIRTDDLEAAVTELKTKGVQVVQDIKVVRPGLKISFVLAPENVLVELLETNG
ncbi:VOC family protein [Chloroflexota bacterium]